MKNIKRKLEAVLYSLCLCLSLGVAHADDTHVIDLSGSWTFAIDRNDEGVDEQWFSKKLTDPITLPGSLQAQGYGNDVDENTEWLGALQDTSWLPNSGKQPDGSYRVAGWLQPAKHYVGAAWYQREVQISKELDGQDFELLFERVHISTTVWLNDERIGSENSLSTPHRYLLEDLPVGTHTLTVRVDNRLPVAVGVNAHCVTDHTQTAWNGIIGKMEMQSVPERWIDAVSVFPDVPGKRVRIKTYFKGNGSAENLTLKLSFSAPDGADDIAPVVVEVPNDPTLETTIALGSNIALWDEFETNLYELSVSLMENNDVTDTKTTRFGMVDYKVGENQQFTVNGRPTFFRGTLDCASFPLTGYPSMDYDYWKRIFEVCKAHGLNHVRYHSWFPPEVALQAANDVGIYLMCEHAWSKSYAFNNENSQEFADYLNREAARAIKRYGNHPSFAMHAYGNEPGGGSGPILTEWVDKAKALDEGRRLYTAAAGWGNTENSDFYALMRGLRVYPWGAGLGSSINRNEPSFDFDFSRTTQNGKEDNIPYVNHEGGQWVAYPNFEEMEKYTGFLKPKNFEIFQENLNDNHMGHLAKDFLMASGRLQTLGYKYCHEVLLRTPGCGGFQMLGLNDFPGQGTALVGAVDVFWDSKPYTSAEEYKQFTGATVPLARFPKFVYTKDERPTLKIDISHYGAKPLVDATARWTIQPLSGGTATSGVLKNKDIPFGLSTLTESHEIDLSTLSAPAQYEFTVSIDGTDVKNSWDFWVYPTEVAEDKGDVKIVRFKADALPLLEKGETVLLVPTQFAINSVEERPTVMGFSSIFWNTAWAGKPPTTLGILCDPEHPIFKSFPTEYHSNYQWWYLIDNAPRSPLLLDGQDTSLRPIVRVVDDYYTNRRLGLVVEAKVGKGKLLISSVNISQAVPDKIVLNQFRKSVLDYMNSPEFNPAAQMDVAQLSKIILTASEADKRTKRGKPGASSDEEYLTDGNTSSLWHTPWRNTIPDYPHEFTIDLEEISDVKAVSFLPRQDSRTNGMVKDVEIYVSMDGLNWGEPLVKATLNNDSKWKKVNLPGATKAKAIKVICLSPQVRSHPWASFAEVVVEAQD